MNLKVLHSTLCPHSLREYVAAEYDVGSISDCRLLKRGWNDTYEVTSSFDRFILRIYSVARTEAEVAYELDFLMHLDGARIPVSIPIAARSGALSTIVEAPEGLRRASLFTFAGGDVPSLTDDSEMARFGALTASVHAASDGFCGSARPLNAYALLEKPMRALAPHLRDRPKDAAFLLRLSEQLRERLAFESDYGPCHGDLHTANVRSSRSGMILFDFDFCGQGSRAYDLATFASIAFMKRARGTWRAFLTGYSDRRPLEASVMALIPTYMIVRFIWLVGIRLERNVEAGEGWLEGYLGTWLTTLRRLAPALDSPPPERVEDLVGMVEDRNPLSRIRSRLRFGA